MTRQETFKKIQEEIVREKAATLGRAGERLEAALAETTALGEAIDRETDPERRAALLREYAAARRQAASARHILVIQREAIGLRHHLDVDRQFPEPPVRR